MLKTSLYFAGLGCLGLLLADLEVATLDPWGELRRVARGVLGPQWAVLYPLQTALANTLIFAFSGLSLAAVSGGVLAFFFSWAPVRIFCALIRAVHEIFWALLFLPAVGLNPLCGVLAIGVPYAGILAKVYAEILQEAEQRPLEGLPPGAGALPRFFYGVWPIISRDVRQYTAYRFECALRSSAVLGFIGLPTLGFHLETAFREGLYGEAAALLYCFYGLIASLRYWVKARLTPLYALLSWVFLAGQWSFSWANTWRFFSYDILPWPMRRAGVADGNFSVEFPVYEVWLWLLELLAGEALAGLWNTLVLTQVVLLGTGLLTLVAFPTVCRHFLGRWPRLFSGWALIVMRSTPEYVLAYLFVQLWGPSMLPAVVAIVLHNAAIMAHLTGGHADGIDLRLDAPVARVSRYFYEILPRVYGQFLAFLLYRWEVMLRESAILGILGVYTLGF